MNLAGSRGPSALYAVHSPYQYTSVFSHFLNFYNLSSLSNELALKIIAYKLTFSSSFCFSQIPPKKVAQYQDKSGIFLLQARRLDNEKANGELNSRTHFYYSFLMFDFSPPESQSTSNRGAGGHAVETKWQAPQELRLAKQRPVPGLFFGATTSSQIVTQRLTSLSLLVMNAQP